MLFSLKLKLLSLKLKLLSLQLKLFFFASTAAFRFARVSCSSHNSAKTGDDVNTSDRRFFRPRFDVFRSGAVGNGRTDSRLAFNSSVLMFDTIDILLAVSSFGMGVDVRGLAMFEFPFLISSNAATDANDSFNRPSSS